MKPKVENKQKGKGEQEQQKRIELAEEKMEQDEQGFYALELPEDEEMVDNFVSEMHQGSFDFDQDMVNVFGDEASASLDESESTATNHSAGAGTGLEGAGSCHFDQEISDPFGGVDEEPEASASSDESESTATDYTVEIGGAGTGLEGAGTLDFDQEMVGFFGGVDEGPASANEAAGNEGAFGALQQQVANIPLVPLRERDLFVQETNPRALTNLVLPLSNMQMFLLLSVLPWGLDQVVTAFSPVALLFGVPRHPKYRLRYWTQVVFALSSFVANGYLVFDGNVGFLGGDQKQGESSVCTSLENIRMSPEDFHFYLDQLQQMLNENPTVRQGLQDFWQVGLNRLWTPERGFLKRVAFEFVKDHVVRDALEFFHI